MKKLLCIPLIVLLVLPLVTEAHDVDELYNAAIALIKAESYAAALTLLESAVKEQQNSPQIHYALGFAREKQGVESDAISSYLMAVKIALQLRLKDKKITKQESRGAMNAFQALDRLTPGRTAVLRKARELAEQSLDMHGTDRRIVNEAVRKLRSIAFETETPKKAQKPRKVKETIRVKDWGVQYWVEGKSRNFNPVGITKYSIKDNRLDIVNTTGVRHVILGYRQTLPKKCEIEIEIRAKGHADKDNYVMLIATDGRSHHYNVRNALDDVWHHYRIRRDGGSVWFWVDGVLQGTDCHHCKGLDGLHFGISVANDQSTRIRNFRLKTLSTP